MKKQPCFNQIIKMILFTFKENNLIFAKKYMLKSLLYLIIGTIISFIINHFILSSQGTIIELYYAFSFGLGWGMAYFLDRSDYTLPQKLGISFLGMGVLLILGLLYFDTKIAIPSMIKFSIVFVTYYLLASFRSSKSLRK